MKNKNQQFQMRKRMKCAADQVTKLETISNYIMNKEACEV